ncbi:MAG: hypothetical protein V1676_01035 [Candidatus Diapherotrites archaeon]
MIKASKTKGLPSGYKTAKQRIEETRFIDFMEMSYFKDKGTAGKMRRGILFRMPWFGIRSFKKGTEKSHIHTHPEAVLDALAPELRGIATSSLPSIGDLRAFVGDAWSRRKKINVWHIATINPYGKVIGYYHLKAQKKLIDMPMKEASKLRATLRHLHTKIGQEKSSIARYSKYRNFVRSLIEKGYFTEKTTPMPGYEYDAVRGIFVEKGGKKASSALARSCERLCLPDKPRRGPPHWKPTLIAIYKRGGRDNIL